MSTPYDASFEDGHWQSSTPSDDASTSAAGSWQHDPAPDDAARPLPALRSDVQPVGRPAAPPNVAPSQALAPWQPGGMAPPPYMGQPLYPPPVETDPRKAAQSGLEMVRRHKWLIFATFFFFFAGVATYTFTATPRYEVYSLLLLDTSQSSSDDPLAVPGENASIASRKLSNQALILGESLPLAARTATRLLALQTIPATGEPFPILHREADEPAWTASELGQYLQKNYITVEQADKELDADAIWVRVISPNAHEAALIANIYTEEYVGYVRETTGKRTVATREFLETQKARHEANLKVLEDQIKQYMTVNSAAALSQEAQSTVQQIASVEAQLDAARIDADQYRATLRSLQAELATLSPQVARRVASTAEQEITTLQNRIAQLDRELNQYYVQNPQLRSNPEASAETKKRVDEIARIRPQIAELSRQVAAEIEATNGLDFSAGGQGVAYLANLNQRIAEQRVSLSGATARVTALEQRLREYTRRMRSIPAQSIELAQLERERQSTETLFLQLEQKLQEAEIAEEAVASFAQAIRPATVPEEAAFPKKGMNLALGAVLGLLLGLAVAYSRERLGGSIHTPEALREANYNVLGSVPNMAPTIKQQLGGAPTVEMDGRTLDSTLLTYLRPHSAPAEAIRHIHAQLFVTPGAARQSVLVTSPDAGAGKSVFALNLSIAAAQAGQRVLLLDADLHQPSCFTKMGLTPQADVVQNIFSGGGGVSIEHFATGLQNHYALSLREQVKITSGLLGSTRMRHFIDQLRQVFDVIIVDAPPVLASADPALLATLTDSTVLLARADQTHVDALDTAHQQLLRVGAVIAGVVLNRFDANKVVGYRAAYKQADSYHRRAA